MKKILYLVTLSEMGGAQKYVIDLATGLDKNQFEVAVAAGGNGPLFERLQNAGIKTFKLKRLKRQINPFRDLAAYFEIRKLLKTWRPDVLHLNSSKISVLGSLAGRNLPMKIAYTVHGAVFKASFSSLSKRLFLWAEKFTAQFKHKIICVSEYDRRLWLEHKVVPAEKLTMIHNGIDPKIDFLTKEEAQKKLLAGKNLAGIKTIGALANFYPEKRLDILIEAANLLIKNPQTKFKIFFILIGSGPLEKQIKTKIAQMGLADKFILTGILPNAARYLKAFDVFVLPSEKEGLPYTIIEAMAAGLPIVASRVGGIPEMVQDGMNGYLISPHDPEALAERVLQLLENPTLARIFAETSLKKVQDFSLAKMLSETEKQY
ncbi:MAG: glycosyltransferase family 4 protein [Candidatus Portnoybacteria bacterium]|nr:glycosyltransferase family 4 protein [Candidatus Portnoybacteria bacterium]